MTVTTLDRRHFLAGTAAVLATPLLAKTAWAQDATTLNFYVGTYATPTQTSPGGQGIYSLSYAPASDAWTLGDVVDGGLPNASFAVYSPKHQLYYVLDEQDDGRVETATHNSYGPAQKTGDVSTHGKAPCYVSLDAAEQTLAVANYSSGNVAFYSLDPATGAPTGEPVIRQNSGSGPNKDRQEGPHAHCVKFSPDQSFIYSVDLGTDQILGYSYDGATGAVGECFTALKLPAGFGPRHLVFHPNVRWAYLVTELSNTALFLHVVGDGKLEIRQQISTLPTGFTAHSQAAHIALNMAGDRLYVSNRGHNSIVVYAIDGDGKLSVMQFAPTLGDWPRFFLMLEDISRLVVAHQNGGTLVVFKLNNDGTLTPAGQTINVPQPVFIGAVA